MQEGIGVQLTGGMPEPEETTAPQDIMEVMNGDTPGIEPNIGLAPDTDEYPDIPEPEDKTVSDFLKGNTREQDELYCDYKCRLWWEGRLRKQYFQGRSIWIGRDKGEARNPERRLRDSKKAIQKREERERVDAIRETQGKLEAKDVECRNRKLKRAFLEACNK